MKPGEFLYSPLLIMPKVPSLLTVTRVLQFHRHAENHMKFLLDIPRLIGFIPIEKSTGIKFSVVSGTDTINLNYMWI